MKFAGFGALIAAVTIAQANGELYFLYNDQRVKIDSTGVRIMAKNVKSAILGVCKEGKALKHPLEALVFDEIERNEATRIEPCFVEALSAKGKISLLKRVDEFAVPTTKRVKLTSRIIRLKDTILKSLASYTPNTLGPDFARRVAKKVSTIKDLHPLTAMYNRDEDFDVEFLRDVFGLDRCENPSFCDVVLEETIDVFLKGRDEMEVVSALKMDQCPKDLVENPRVKLFLEAYDDEGADYRITIDDLQPQVNKETGVPEDQCPISEVTEDSGKTANKEKLGKWVDASAEKNIRKPKNNNNKSNKKDQSKGAALGKWQAPPSKKANENITTTKGKCPMGFTKGDKSTTQAKERSKAYKEALVQFEDPEPLNPLPKKSSTTEPQDQENNELFVDEFAQLEEVIQNVDGEEDVIVHASELEQVERFSGDDDNVIGSDELINDNSDNQETNDTENFFGDVVDIPESNLQDDIELDDSSVWDSYVESSKEKKQASLTLKSRGTKKKHARSRKNH